MIKEGKYLIKIISSVINNEKLDFDSTIDYAILTKMAIFHSVESLLYTGIINNNLDIPNELKEQLHKINLLNIYKDQTQEHEKELLATKLENNKIEHLFLKGSVIKYLYPFTHFRSMADIDILISTNKLNNVKDIMLSLDYKAKHLGGNHDVYNKEPFMNIEIHRAMLDEVYETAIYYKNIWDKLLLVEGKTSEYYLRDEDYYIYLIVHLAKHFSNGGTGIRSVLDIYIYLKHKENSLDWNYINKEFEKLDILNFSNNLRNLSFSWFSNLSTNDIYEAIGEYIISSGTYGVSLNASIVKGFMEEDNRKIGSKKFRFIFKNMFPNFKKMKTIFPILKKLPFLLPVFWFIRLFKIIIFRRKNIKNIYQDLSSINNETIKKIKDVHKKSKL